MTAFSRVEYNKNIVLLKVRRAKQLARSNPDFKIIHPGEARDAGDGKYTLLTKRVKEDIEKKQQTFAGRIAKRHVKI